MKAKFIKPEMVRILNSISIDTIKVPNKNYEIGKYPITTAEYMHFARDTNTHYPEWVENAGTYKDMNLSDNAPIIGVSWYDAVAYCEWLSQKTGKSYRLPLTEEEWVYAVKQNEEGIDSFGNAVSNTDDYAWFYDNSGGTTHIVGEKQAYSLDIYDMYGNVREWTKDIEDEDKAGVCGGSWNMSKYDWHFDNFDKNTKSNDLGFRVVLEMEEQEKIKNESRDDTKLEKERVVPKQLTKTLGSNIDFVVAIEKDIKHIDSLLLKNNKILITGAGGIGKTTLVSMYLEKVKDDYDYLAYVRIEQNHEQSIVHAFAESLDIVEGTLDNMYNIVIHKLNRLKGKKLIVIDEIDNVDNIKIFNEFIDMLEDCKIITVSRNVPVADIKKIPIITIGKLSYQDAKVLLTSKVKKDITEDELELILKYLDPSPLLINKVVALIDNENVSMNQILNMLDSNSKIYVPANGRVYEFEVNNAYYDMKIHQISEKTINESQATREMVDATGATHQGTIKFKDNTQGNIEELNKLIDEQFNKEYGLAFYSIINDDETKNEYLDFVKAESEMEGWFSENYDDPANFLPYETREGGYQYLYGGPYELDELLYEEFEDKYPDEYIKQVIKGLENQYGDVGWAKKPDEDNSSYVEKGYVEEGYFESDDPYDPKVREQEIKKMEANALEKTIEERIKYLADMKSSNNVIESQINGKFNGWKGKTIIKLMNGELWQQTEYYYYYHYAYMPKVTVINSPTGYKMKVDGIDKEVSVKKLKNAIQTNIQGTFNGWDGNTVVELTNGEKWKQSSYAYSYSYAYNPEVIIYESDYGYKMKVDGNDEAVDVKRYYNL